MVTYGTCARDGEKSENLEFKKNIDHNTSIGGCKCVMTIGDAERIDSINDVIIKIEEAETIV